jgi:NADH:ubiquinone oxidoreductase subunit 6 (subunit J)
VLSLAVGYGITWLGVNHPWIRVAEPTREGTLPEIGIALLTTYSMAFETISLVLVVAILGAVVIARHGRTQP